MKQYKRERFSDINKLNVTHFFSVFLFFRSSNALISNEIKFLFVPRIEVTTCYSLLSFSQATL